MAPRKFLMAVAVLLAGCAAQPAPPIAVPIDFPVNLRAQLFPQWVDQNKRIKWPSDDGCASAPVPISLPAGMVIDRFGSEGGNFFSTPDQSFGARAMPYICPRMAYTVYRVKKTLAAEACPAVGWFGEPGGAPQFKTAQNVAALIVAGMIEPDLAATIRAGSPCAR
jgi:hypothetical protein